MMSRTQVIFSLILVVAFGLRVTMAMHWQQQATAEQVQFRLGDSHSYWILAGHLARGEPYHYGSPDASIFRAPLYPILLAPFTLIPDESRGVWMARLAGCLLGTVAVGLIGLLATRIRGTLAGQCAAAVAACYPAAVGMSISLLSEALFLPLMVAHLLLWQSAWRAGTNVQVARYALAAGCLGGLAILARPSWLLWTPFAGALGLLVGGQRPRHLWILVFSLLGIGCVMTPWWLRNAAVTGRFVLTTLQVGPSLYDGLHEGATGASDEGMTWMFKFRDEQLAADRASKLPLDSTLEYRINRRAQRSAIDWAVANPVEAVHLGFRKFLRTWSVWPGGGEVGSTSIRAAISVSCFAVLGLGTFASIVVLRPFGWFEGICWVPCLYFTLLHMVFVGSVRYREPAMFVLVALAGCAIAYFVERSRQCVCFARKS
jgi:hypothetical protein